MSYAIYLRKSRADIEAEARGEGETLARHQVQLLEFARKQNLDIGIVYKELVSAETIAARPVMQKLIQEVSCGKWEGVICMEVERLARGDTMDQGLVSQAFKFSGTKIVTPLKVYNPDNEFDEEYFEFSLFMSRREYKTIRRRMQAGRIASVSEGNYIGSLPPFGYKKVHNYEGNFFTLEPIEWEASTVRLIYELYTGKDMGYSKIATYLNMLSIPPKRADAWSASSVKDIIENPVYCGKLRWNRRKTRKKLVDGKVVYSRPKSEGTVYEGKHPAIISEKMWQSAQNVPTKVLHSSNHFNRALKNQFIGLLYCGICSHAMVRRPYKNKATYYMCNHKGCSCKSSVENEINEALTESLKKHYNKYRVAAEKNETKKSNTNAEVIKSAEIKLEKLKKQQLKLYDLLEQEVYTTEVFIERSDVLNQLIEDLEKIIKQEVITEISNIHEEMNITLHTVIEDYYKIDDAEKKNRLLKKIINRINYVKTSGGRYGKSDLTLYIDYLF